MALMLAAPRFIWASSGVSHAPDNDEEVCDPIADYFLGMEDYPEAIRRHLMVISRNPDNALAHYHLGFAYGMIGRHKEELEQYRDAIDLGLSDWQLFLNLGLLYLESQRLSAASDVLRLATLLGPDRPETHFNLGLVYERRGMLAPAEQEILLSLRLDADQPDALNTLGVIYAEEGNYARAREEWTDLLRTRPDYQPARANLTILDRAERGQMSASFAHPH
jgi:protein O-mannosyl-transferase